jgi:hypothetical protein
LEFSKLQITDLEMVNAAAAVKKERLNIKILQLSEKNSTRLKVVIGIT